MLFEAINSSNLLFTRVSFALREDHFFRLEMERSYVYFIYLTPIFIEKEKDLEIFIYYKI
jgi:hypothetical protein